MVRPEALLKPILNNLGTMFGSLLGCRDFFRQRALPEEVPGTPNDFNLVCNRYIWETHVLAFGLGMALGLKFWERFSECAAPVRDLYLIRNIGLTSF